ncbi:MULTISPECIES: hypothetical protein [unclassified Cyanobium]|uniref:hypothetical protein n=1 Tax=unclassified Cyanobium TaxID=2627006 RepID=UPI0020CE5738|nr:MULTISPECIES: hypothetical protein [unclassified Cyanobium]MCP9834672.1 hypothetical protein [Cyanobium sp. La Preciosa 7G6]MCP9937467.1 hypothetical protein [Cyanobium sp. Aljojuca 7A6]
MTVGELYLESLSTGIITPTELSWLAHGQDRFSRLEEATALRLGRLLDQGDIQLGCRLVSADPPTPKTTTPGVLEEWIEPLGRQRHR